jgi:hypothetical protein
MRLLIVSFVLIGLLEALPLAKKEEDSLADFHQALSAPISRAVNGECRDAHKE